MSCFAAEKAPCTWVCGPSRMAYQRRSREACCTAWRGCMLPAHHTAAALVAEPTSSVTFQPDWALVAAWPGRDPRVNLLLVLWQRLDSQERVWLFALQAPGSKHT